MWSSFKSWWYWNVSSKYDSIDLFVYIFYPALVVALIIVMIGENKERKEFTVACEAKGGVAVKADRKFVCIDKEVIK